MDIYLYISSQMYLPNIHSIFMISSTVLDCGDPSELANATYTATGTSYQDNTSYTCDTGFEPSNGASVMTYCQDDGQWSGMPICQRMLRQEYMYNLFGA